MKNWNAAENSRAECLADRQWLAIDGVFHNASGMLAKAIALHGNSVVRAEITLPVLRR